eukprot:scaffold40039_cov25-Tisochrysis_lutea.AAC.2
MLMNLRAYSKPYLSHDAKEVPLGCVGGDHNVKDPTRHLFDLQLHRMRRMKCMCISDRKCTSLMICQPFTAKQRSCTSPCEHAAGIVKWPLDLLHDPFPPVSRAQPFVHVIFPSVSGAQPLHAPCAPQ